MNRFILMGAMLLAGSAWTQTVEESEQMQAALEAFAKGEFEKSRDAFLKITETRPEDPLAHLNLGTVEFRLKNHEAAAKALEEAVRLDARNSVAWLTLGIVSLEQSNHDAALAALSRAVQLDPRNPRAHAYLGVAVGQRGWLFGAEKELQTAIELQPDYAEAHFNLALFYLQRTPPAIELARRHYQRARDLGAEPDELVEKQIAAGTPEKKK